MARGLRKVKPFVKDLGKELLSEILADWLKYLIYILIPVLVGIGLFIWRILRTEVSLRIPVGIICLFAGFWAAVPLIIALVLRRLRTARWTGIGESNGLLWKLDQGKVVGGPFCPRCKELLEQVHGNFDQEMGLLLEVANDSSYQATKLHCPRCEATYSFNQSLDTLKERVETQASADLR